MGNLWLWRELVCPAILQVEKRMYLPSLFVETNLVKLHDLIDDYNFGTLFCQMGRASVEIEHIPFILDRTDGPNGSLLGHVAKSNQVWHSFERVAPVVIVFHGPHGYISPAWYTTREAVPTWNYAVVHAQGKPRVLDENELVLLLERLVSKHEGQTASAWSVAEIRKETFQELKREIVGFRMRIEKITGKFKLGQNRVERDRQGAIEGLRRREHPLDAALAKLMADALGPY